MELLVLMIVLYWRQILLVIALVVVIDWVKSTFGF
jgi:hypothetical protein